MSLSRLAVRIAAQRALSGQTLAGARVYDSQIDPIDLTVQGQREPFIVLYTDDHLRSVSGRDLSHGEDTLDLVIEIAVATKVLAPARDEDGDVTDAVEIPQTDAGMEVVLDILEYQAMQALQAGRTEWSRVWQRMTARLMRRLSRRGASNENGVRFAARQITITCDPIGDPDAGTDLVPGTAWGGFLAALDADAELSGIADVVRHAVTTGAPMSDWRLAAERLGVSDETVDAIGLAPVLDLEGAPVGLEQVDVELEGDEESPWQIVPEDTP